METGISAIILAAGYGNRMGRIKPLLPLGEGSVIGHVAACFRAADVFDITVVLGHRLDAVMPELEKQGLSCVVNERYSQGMFSSIQKGLETQDAHTRACFIMPVDIPLVRPSTLKTLTTAHDAHPGNIIHPVFQGKRGHPPLIPASFASAILNYDGSGGLRRCLASLNSAGLDVAVPDEGVLIDMDTPGDYASILDRYDHLAIPNEAEARELLNIHKPDNPLIMGHARAVASVGKAIGKALNRAGRGVNVPLTAAAGMLHDIARGQPDHARKGAEWIAASGFPKVADVVRQHMDLVFEPSAGVHEAEVVYLADKMVSGSGIVPLQTRKALKEKRFINDPEALKMMTFRMTTALAIQKQIETIVGTSLDSVLSGLTVAGE